MIAHRRRVGAALLLATVACGGGDGPTAPDPDPSPTVVEARALWVSRFEFATAADVATILDAARRANFNVVLLQVRGAADALYRSSIEPCAVALCGRLGGTPTWDPLEVAVREAHARGLELHAWVNALTGLAAGSAASCGTLVESQAGNPRHALLTNPEWRVVNAAGVPHACPNAEEYVWLSPGIPAVRARLARVAADIARRYDVDGIHLDRIRYPGTAWSHDAASLAAFGGSPAQDATGWAAFRRSQVERTVREVRDSIRAVRTDVELSAAVWGIHRDIWGWRSSEGYGQYLQDPRSWARSGAFDVAVPMTYFGIASSPCGFADWSCLLDDHLAGYRGTAARVWIGVPANRGSAEVLRQVALGREREVPGFALYSYSSAASAMLFDALAAGPFRTPSVVR